MDSDPIHPDSDVSPKFVVKSQRNAWAAWAAQAGVLPLPLPSLLRALTDGNEDAEMCSFDFGFGIPGKNFQQTNINHHQPTFTHDFLRESNSSCIAVG